MINSQIYYFFRILKTTFTPFRIFNALKLEISYRLSVIGVSTNWKLSPFFISIEPVNVCNLHCPECPTGMQTKNVKPTNIDDVMTRNVIDELQNTLTHVIFYFQGEPLLNRNFTNLVNYAYSK
ncbi:MAG: Radical domain protein, partial [Bacteroidetes bacterium]|nr:Radical domain protein [Bacteroidota bacterium]